MKSTRKLMLSIGANLVFALFTWCDPPFAATPPEVTVSAEPQTATVGDRITVKVEIPRILDFEVVPSPRPVKLGEFDVLSDTSYRDRWGEGDRVAHVRELIVAAFRPGSYWIPAFTGQVRGKSGEFIDWQTDSIPITITSVLAEAGADTTDIKGLKAPYVAPETAWWGWIAAALVVLALGAYLRHRFRKRPAIALAAVPPKPAWEIAMAELALLQRDVDPRIDGGRLWYFRLSEILRRYWDRRFGWQSIDQTTTEIVRELPAAPFHERHRMRAEEFLRFADRVRYAKQPAREGQPENDLNWVKTHVHDTIPIASFDLNSQAEAQKESQPA